MTKVEQPHRTKVALAFVAAGGFRLEQSPSKPNY